MSEKRRVLLPYDFSSHAQRALSLALDGVPFGADVVIDVLHVIDERVYKRTLPDAMKPTAEAMSSHFASEVARATTPERKLRDDPKLTVVFGDPTHEVLSRAETYGGILIGGQGHGGWTETFLGTTAMRVVREAPCSVYVTKKANSLAPPARVLCAVDYEPGSTKALSEAQALCRVSNAELELMHVIAIAPPGLGHPIAFPYPTARDIDEERKVLVDFERATLREPLGKKHVVAFAPSGVAHNVAHQAALDGVDTVVVGARNRDLAKRLFGSASEGIVQRAPCDVYVVR